MAVPTVSLLRSSAADFVHALREHGFLVLKDHGADRGILKKALAQSRTVFDLPLETKKRIMLRGAETGFRGFQICGQNITQGKADQHEGLDLMRECVAPENLTAASENDADPALFLYKKNLWPPEDEAPGLRAAFEAYTEEMQSLGFRIMAKVDAGLRETCSQEEALRMKEMPLLYNDPFWIMRAIRYPAAGGGGEEQGVGEHRDYGLLTMILADETPGCLQVRRADGDWAFVDPVPDCLVVNIGDVLDFWTDGYFKATPHRVLAPRDQERISLPFFFEPNLEAPILPDGTTYRDHVLGKLTNNFVDTAP